MRCPSCLNWCGGLFLCPDLIVDGAQVVECPALQEIGVLEGVELEIMLGDDMAQSPATRPLAGMLDQFLDGERHIV